MDDEKNCSGDSTKAMACMDEEKDDGVGPYVNSDEESGPMKKQGGQNIDFQLKNIISQNPEGQQQIYCDDDAQWLVESEKQSDEYYVNLFEENNNGYVDKKLNQ